MRCSRCVVVFGVSALALACAPAAPPIASAGPVPVPSASSAPTAVDPCDEAAVYIPMPAWSGARPALPPVPTLPVVAVKMGADYTVTGAVLTLRSLYRQKELAGDITIVGVIVGTNEGAAPACARHSIGKATPPGCVAEVPSFTIAYPGADASAPRIRVLGWASNFAHVFEAQRAYKGLTQAPTKPLKDDLWGVDLPFPLPAVGAKVRVHGQYGVAFNKSARGMISDPDNGVFTVSRVETIVPWTDP